MNNYYRGEELKLHDAVMETPITVLPTIVLRKEVDRIVKMLKKQPLSRIRDILEGKGLIKKISKLSKINIMGLAIDTGFTDPPLELTGGKLVIILKAHTYFGSKLRRTPLAEVKGFIRFIQESEGRADLLSKIIERRFILKVLKEKDKGKDEVNLILLDGELFPRVPPGLIQKEEKSTIHKLYIKYLELTKDILELADKTDTALIGVLKRVYGYDILVLTNIFDVEVNDKALATYILEPGEWIYLKTYADIEAKLEEVIEKHVDKLKRDMQRRFEERYRWIRTVISIVEQASNINIIVYKALSPAYFMLATKIEVWPSMTLLKEDIVSYLAGITGVNGVPHPIDIVDSMTRITPELLYTIQQQLFTKISENLGDSKLALSMVGLTNPEKLKIIGIR